MAKGKRYPSAQVMLYNVKPTWVTLSKPDTEYNADGSYGIGFAATDEHAQALNATAEKVTEGTDIPVKYVKAGDIVKVTLKASGLDRKNNVKWFDTPSVFTADLQKATTEQVAAITKKSRLNINVSLQPYEAPIGKGVSLRMAAVQIVDLVKAAEATDFGFAPVGADNSSDEESPF